MKDFKFPLATFLLFAALVTALFPPGCTNDKQSIQPAPKADTTTVTVYTDSVFIMWPDTITYHGANHVLDNDTWRAWFGNVRPDTTGKFTHKGIYHAYVVTGFPDSVVIGDPIAWAYWSPLKNGERAYGAIDPATGVLEFRPMTGATIPDTPYHILIRETGGRP